VILRGGSRSGPNYRAHDVADACSQLRAAGLVDRVMVDCSHGNSGKDHRRQIDVAADLCDQVAGGTSHVFGVMLESHLVEGRQALSPGVPLTYGQSVTDACLSLEETLPVLERLATARRRRAGRAASASGVC